MKNEPTVHYNSLDAAEFVTVSGWRSRTGQFWGDNEHAARWGGCTHVACKDCGVPTPKSRLVCDACNTKRQDARYAALPLIEWDGETPLATFDGDQYFFDAESVDEWCETHEVDPADLQLVICEPQYLREVDIDYWEDSLPEDGEPGDAVLRALDALNAAVKAHGPASWLPGKKRIEWTSETVSEVQK